MNSGISLLEQLDPKQILEGLDRADSEQSLRRFIELSWHILEPNRTFIPGWHLDAICEHLEAVTNGQILRLLINVPPGCMKSLTTDVFWPAWEWGPRNRPDIRYVSASYSEDLTIRDNRRCRNLILASWYQRLWGNRFSLMGDQNAKTRFDTDKTGFKIATSVGGLGTGERGDRFIIDDPHNIKDGESDAKREACNLWFTETVPTRMNDPEKSAIVVIMQRVHDADVSGLILARELGYVHLMLPMKFEPERGCKTSIGFKDPRKKDGDLLWPDRMTKEVVERDSKVMGEYATAAQFQQRPAPRGGGMFKRDWFPVVPYAPPGGESCRGWDLASSETVSSAFTCGVKIKKVQGIFYIEHVNRFRGTPNKVEREMKKTAVNDGVRVRISAPQDPGQAGKAQKMYIARQLVGYNIRFSPETGDKATRAEPFAAQAEAGNVRIVAGDWNEAFLEELCLFPFSTFKDQVDAASRAFNELVKKGMHLIGAPPKTVRLNYDQI